MTRLTKCCLILGVALTGLTLCGESKAQNPMGGYGVYGIGPYGLNGLNGRAYSSGRIPTPPYFALHPPVYYSQAVPRTYGHSPFAYPGIYRTPEVKKSAMIVNPHVQPGEPTPAEPEKTDTSMKTASHSQPKVQIIVNPFVVQTKEIKIVN